MKRLTKTAFGIALLFQSMAAAAQTPAKITWNNDPVVYVNFDNNTSLKTITVKDGLLDIDKLPGKMVLTFPNEKKKKISIGFNQEKSKDFFKVSEVCNEKEECVPLLASDFKSGTVELLFHKNELIMVGGRIVKPRKIAAGKPVIKIFLEDITEVAAGENEEEEPSKKPFPDSDKRQKTITVTKEDLANALRCLCEYSSSCVEKTMPNKKTDVNKEIGKDLRRQGVVYLAEYDAVTKNISWFALDTAGSQYRIMDISAIRLYANSEIKIIVNGLDSVDYVLSADGEIFFMDNGTDLASVNKQLLEDFKNTPAPKDPGGPAATPPTTPGDVQAAKKKFADSVIKDPDAFPLLSQMNATAMQTITDSIEEVQFIPRYIDSFTNATAEPRLKDTAKIRVELSKLREHIVEMARSFTDLYAIDVENRLKAKLLALDKFLEDFNTVAATSDFSAYRYLDKLNRLHQGIKSCLQIPVTEDAADLKNALIHLVTATPVGEEYYTEFSQIINAIEAQYGKALDRLKHRKTFITSLQVPDADRVKIMLHGNKGSTPLIERTFNVRGGFKIDFSSGIFFSGMSSPEYVLSKSFFRYRESRDTVIIRPNSPDPVDSAIYTGNILSATGDFIRKNKKSLSYGAGFFAHGYWRQGRPLQFGIAAGLVLNNTGMVQGMLGGCAMISAGKQRISLLGGIAVGRVTRLSASANQYVYKDEYAGFENGQTIFANERALPRFFDTSNSNEIPTYEKWAGSYFIGLAFNFATIPVGKSKND